ncbi:two-component system sensor histidine kinase RppB [Chlorogloea sp. CCALA 695]|uniref:two-component system sensor histidine kinase RppB n=1 Tax=Chlorogloea sp. CCALA 695 TaxID=2107693 RepID=UPI000D0687F8|nr:two-component system sensor histidine kinase RppB [Chlorogloea sp. CCALA 695]PSB32507.1 two-component sensor histidine kinase [Chlorogloea sp. CCALA 695]
MNQNRLFHLTRWRLAAWYAVVMGFILGLCGLGVYQAIVHAHWQTLDRELESVAGTLHDSIENTLKQPGRLEPTTQQLLPEEREKRHILGAIHQGDYYVRLLDNSNQIVTLAGFQPQELRLISKKGTWQTLKDAQGSRYHQISLSLHTQNNISWGSMQMGRSLQDIDNYLANVKLILLLGLPIAMILVGASSWWLSGLAMQPIYQSYQQIQQFTADAAHELRTPLAATQATIESALRLYSFTSETQDIFSAIERQNRRLTQLVTDLLLLARMEKQPLSVQNRCCLNDLVSDLVEELASLAMPAAGCAYASHIQLTSKFKLDKPLTVLGNESQLYQVVSNLIINAIQSTPKGGRVTVTLERNHNYAVINIQDTGIGIDASEQKRIFERFYRVNSDRSRNTGGSGLGLAIASVIVQAHKGSLQVQSQLGKGSTFTVRLPLATNIFHKDDNKGEAR